MIVQGFRSCRVASRASLSPRRSARLIDWQSRQRPFVPNFDYHLFSCEQRQRVVDSLRIVLIQICVPFIEQNVLNGFNLKNFGEMFD